MKVKMVKQKKINTNLLMRVKFLINFKLHLNVMFRNKRYSPNIYPV